jgi:hypothetical protein
MATVLSIRSGFDLVRIVRIIGGEYAGASRNIESILKAVVPVFSSEDYEHIRQFLTRACPYELPFDEDESNTITATKR